MPSKVCILLGNSLIDRKQTKTRPVNLKPHNREIPEHIKSNHLISLVLCQLYARAHVCHHWARTLLRHLCHANHMLPDWLFAFLSLSVFKWFMIFEIDRRQR